MYVLLVVTLISLLNFQFLSAKSTTVHLNRDFIECTNEVFLQYHDEIGIDIDQTQFLDMLHECKGGL